MNTRASPPLLAAMAAAMLSNTPAVSAQAPPNPFAAPSPLPLHYPQFDLIRDSDFAPAFDAGMAEQLREIAAIANSSAAPSFQNTLLALEASGQVLQRARTVFYALVGADTNDARNKLRDEYEPRFAAHEDAVLLDGKLFARIETLYGRRESLGLDAEGVRLIERYYSDFVRAGARLSAAEKQKLMAMNVELAKLSSGFSQNVLDEVNASAVVVEDVKQLAGLSASQVAAAAQEARTRGLDGRYVLTLLNTTGQPLESQLTDRAMRQRLHEASVVRGSRGGQYDNTAIVSRTMQLRAERALLLGYPNHAAYSLEDQTARTPEAVNAMLRQLAPPAVANARREAAELQARMARDGAANQLAAWDWSFYSEKVRAEKFAYDESQLKPYLELTSVLENGVFFAANQLYGLTFKRRTDLPVYHPDVRVYDVLDADGKQLGIFLADMYARKSKRGGAWMNSYVSQSTMTKYQPVVANHLNIPKPPAGEPTLLTWHEVTTCFHEFGHALHGLFSNVTYPYFSGTAVPRDFVEFPSQVNEMWADWPAVLRNYARHWQTGAPMPQELLDKVVAASKFNQGFKTTEYLGAAMLDQRWHQITAREVPAAAEVMAFEARALAADGLDFAPVPPRYRTPYFSHIMGGYAAGYYAYIWSEVLDANTQKWFQEHGGLTRANGDRFRSTLLSRGGSVDALQLFRNFAGHEPQVQPLLEKRGLVPEVPAAR